MDWWRNRLHCLFLALLLWENANGLGVWQNRPAHWYRHGAKGPGDQVLSPVQQDVSSTASGFETAAYTFAATQPLSTSGSGEPVANVPGFLRQYTTSSDQNVLNQYNPQSQGGYTAQASGPSNYEISSRQPQSSTNQAAPGIQSQPVSRLVSPSQGSASQSLVSQQSSLQLASPSLGTSSPVQSLPSLDAPRIQAQLSRPVSSSWSSASDSATTSQQASYGSQSSAGTVYGQPSSWYSVSQGQSVQTSSQYGPTSDKPVLPSQGSASQSFASQQSSLQLASPGLGFSSLLQSLPSRYIPGTQAQSSRPVTVSLSSASDSATTSWQDGYGSQSSAGALYGQPSSLSSASQGLSVQTSAQYGATSDKPVFPSQGLSSYTSLPQTPSQSEDAPFKPVSPLQGTLSQSLASQQGSLQYSPSLGTSSAPQSLLSRYVPGIQAQLSRTVGSSSSLARDSTTTSQQASYGSQSSPGQGVQTSTQSDSLYKPGLPSQGSASQSLVSQQSSLQLASPSLGISSPVQSLPSLDAPRIQAQPSRPVGSSWSLARDSTTTSQQASYGSQSSAGTLYGQPSSWYSSSQGQSVPTSTQSDSLYRPGLPSQGSASQSLASQQSSLQLASPSLGIPSPLQSLPSPYVPGIQAQSSRPVPVSLSSTSDSATTSQQTSYGSQSLAGTVYGQPSSWYSSQGPSVQTSTQSDSLYKPVLPSQGLVSAYTAGPAQWYRVDPFSFQAEQTDKPLFSSQGSVGQAAFSSYPSTSQSQSTPGSFGFGFQSQSAPASTVALTQSAAQFPSFQTSSRFSTAPLNAASPSASVSQPFQGAQSSVTWRSPSVSPSLSQSSSGQVAPVAATQQYSSGVSQSTGFYASLPSQGASTSQMSASYRPVSPSSTTQVRSFDQYNPASSASSTSAQATPTNFGLVQSYSSQALGASVQQQPAVASSLSQQIFEAQGGASVSDSSSLYSFERSGSVYKPATRRASDSSIKQ